MSPEVTNEDLRPLTVKKEVTEKEELNISGLLNEANKVFEDNKEALSDLPDDFQNDLKKEMVRYFISSADSFDKNAISGLDKTEFANYKQAMIMKLKLTIDKNTFSKEQIAERKKQIEARKESAEKIKDIANQLDNLKTDGTEFNPQNLTTPEGIQQEMIKLHKFSQDIGKDGQKIIELVTAAQEEGVKYSNSNKTDKAQQRLDRAFGMNTDHFYETSTSHVSWAVKKAQNPEALKQLKKKKEDLAKYGNFILEGGSIIRQKLESARNQQLFIAMNMKQDVGNKEKYEAYKNAKEMLMEKRRQLLDNKDDILIESLDGDARPSDEEHKKTQASIETAVTQIDAIRNNPNIDQERKDFLLDQKNKLLGAKAEGYNDDKFKSDKKTEIKRKLIHDYLSSSVDPAINTMDDSIKSMEFHQLSNGNPVEKVQAQFGIMLDSVDKFNQANNDTLMSLNLQNSLMLHNIEKASSSLKIPKQPTLWQAGWQSFGGVISEKFFKEGIADNLSKYAKKLHDIGGPLKLVSGAMNLIGGVAEGVGELIDGVATVVATPKEAAKGLGALAGRNPATGKWGDWEMAGKAWKAMGEGFVGAKEFQESQYGRGTGKAIFNILLTVTGFGAAAKGTTGARLAWNVSKNNFATRGQQLTAAASAFVKDFTTGMGQGLWKIAKDGYGFTKNLTNGTTIKNVAKGLADRARGIPQVLGNTVEWMKYVKETKGGALLQRFNNKAKYYTEMSKRTKGVKYELKFQEFCQENIINLTDDALNFQNKLAKRRSELGTEADALRDVANSNPELYQAWVMYQKNNQVMRVMQQSIDVKVLSPELVKYRNEARGIGEMADFIGKKIGKDKTPYLEHLCKKWGVPFDKNATRESHLLQLNEKMKGASAAAFHPEFTDVKRWLHYEKKFGNRADNYIKLQKDITQIRDENYLHTDSLVSAVKKKDSVKGAKVEETASKYNEAVENQKKITQEYEKLDNKAIAGTITQDELKEQKALLDAKLDKIDAKVSNYKQKLEEYKSQFHNEYNAAKEGIMATKTQEMLGAAGVDITKELQLMHNSLYSKALGTREWDLSKLNKYDTAKLKDNPKLATQYYAELEKNIMNHVEQFGRGNGAMISMDDTRLIQTQLKQVIETAKSAGVTPENIIKLMKDSADKLVYQTAQSMKRQLGDHGIHHVMGNIRANERAMAQYETNFKHAPTGEQIIKFTDKDKLEMMISNINHDMGYAFSQTLRGFATTGSHPYTSAHLLQQGDMAATFKEVFGADHRRMYTGLMDHDGAAVLGTYDAAALKRMEKTMSKDTYAKFLVQMKYNAMHNSLRFADNLALYSFDKLPPLFFQDNKLINLLTQVEHATTLENPILIESIKNQMRGRILELRKSGKISETMASGYYSAIDEVTQLTSKSSLGMLAGQHGTEVFNLVPHGPHGRLVPVLRLEGSPVFGEIEEALRLINSKNASAAEKLKGAATFDGATQQFMKIMEDYATKNNCSLKINGRTIWHEGLGDFKSTMQEIKSAIANGYELDFVKDNKLFMKVGLKTAERSLGNIDDALMQAKTPGKRVSIINDKKTSLENDITQLDKQISKALTNHERESLLIQRIDLQMQLRQMDDMRIAVEMLKDTETIIQIRTLKEANEALDAIKNGDPATLGDRLLDLKHQPGMDPIIQMYREAYNFKIAGNETKYQQKLTELMEGIQNLEVSTINKLFTKYKAPPSPSTRDNVVRYLKMGAAAGLSAIFLKRGKATVAGRGAKEGMQDQEQ